MSYESFGPENAHFDLELIRKLSDIIQHQTYFTILLLPEFQTDNAQILVAFDSRDRLLRYMMITATHHPFKIATNIFF